MLKEARNQKLITRINKLLQKYIISEDITYSLQEKDNIYQCVIKYQKDGVWDSLWASTGLKKERGNIRQAKKEAEEIANIFKETIKDNKSKNEEKEISISNFQTLAELNTTNYNPQKTTKSDWDFYDYMEYWLYKIIKKSVEQDTFNGYGRNVTKRMKDYFTQKKNRRKVKELTADDLDDFYEYLREQGLKNSSIEHYNDNISGAFKVLLKKKLVRYNPTDMINPIVVEVVEVSTYTETEINELFDILKGDIIELPTLFGGYYGLRRSEIIGLRKEAFDFENNNFVINHVAIQNDGKKHQEKVYFKDKTKSKKGCRVLPLLPIIKENVLKKLEQIEENKKIFGNSYNYKYDGYICVQDNGDLIQPGFFTKRFAKIIKRNNLRKITPHGLRHSIATLLHLKGVDIRDLQDWLGHESVTSTNRYTRSDYKKQVATGGTVLQIFDKKDNFNENNKKNINVKKFIVKKKEHS
ncbi:MAG: site-specific integrase [Clostridium sp.]|nr:site-specific integrase [Clostridium sp.]